MNDYYDDLDTQSRRPGLPVDPRRLLLLLRRGWYWIVAVLALAAPVGVVAAKTLVPLSYEAIATLTVGAGGREPLNPLEAQSLVDTIKLPENLERVRERMGLAIPVDGLGEFVDVEFNPRRSNMVTVRTTWATAEEAAKLANTVAKVFIRYEERETRLGHEATVQALNGDLEVATARLNEARHLYDAVRREKGIAEISVETQLAIEEAARLRFQADQAATKSEQLQEAVGEAKGRLEEAEKDRGTSAFSSTEQAPEDFRAELAKARARLRAVSTRLPPEHPTVKTVEAEVKALEERLPQAKRVTSAAYARRKLRQALRSQEAAEAAAARAVARVRELAQDQSQVTSLLTDVRLAEAHVEELKAKLTRSRETARGSFGSVRLLSAAEPPAYALKSKRRLVAIAAAMGASVLGVLAILVWTFWGFRLHTATEAAFWARAPAVGASTWPAQAEALPAFVDDLCDYAPSAAGWTLLVPASDAERGPTEELARWVNLATGRTSDVEHGTDTEQLALAENPHASARAHAIEARVTADRVQAPSDLQLAGILPWTGPLGGPVLRRAARLADRVLIAILAGAESGPRLAQMRTILGREDGVGVLVLGVDPELAASPDRVGELDEFWHGRRGEEG